jgi:hypothetical protein
LDLFYDISLAIFGSALLGFIMSLIEYHTAKLEVSSNIVLLAHETEDSECRRRAWYQTKLDNAEKALMKFNGKFWGKELPR